MWTLMFEITAANTDGIILLNQNPIKTCLHVPRITQPCVLVLRSCVKSKTERFLCNYDLY